MRISYVRDAAIDPLGGFDPPSSSHRREATTRGWREMARISTQEAWAQATSETTLTHYLDYQITNATAPGRDGMRKCHLPEDLVPDLSQPSEVSAPFCDVPSSASGKGPRQAT